MIKTEHIDVWGFEHAIRGMRKSYNSMDRSDSKFTHNGTIIGDNDLALMKGLYKAGQSHRKWARQVMVSMDVTAPLYWWKQFDTYKVGTTANSESTMHTIMSKEFDASDFSFEATEKVMTSEFLEHMILVLNELRDCYVNFDDYVERGVIMEDTEKGSIFKTLIELLPSGFLQTRTITLSYENIFAIIEQRSHHKLSEWQDFISDLKCLPYIKTLTEKGENNGQLR
jgi:hypothetical protein